STRTAAGCARTSPPSAAAAPWRTPSARILRRGRLARVDVAAADRRLARRHRRGAAAGVLRVAQALLAENPIEIVAAPQRLLPRGRALAVGGHAAALARRDRAAGDGAVAGAAAVAAHAGRGVAAAGIGRLRPHGAGEGHEGCRRGETDYVHICLLHR